MRHIVEFDYWYKGEFEKLCSEYKNLPEEERTRVAMDDVFAKKHRESFTIEADSKNHALAKAWAFHAKLDMAEINEEMSSFEAIPAPYLTIRELLSEAPVVNESTRIYPILEFFPEVDSYELDDDQAEADAKDSERLKICYYVNVCFDGRRGMAMACVFWDDEPVLVFQEAGRENEDHQEHWVVNAKAKREMTAWLLGFVKKDEEEETSLDEEIPELSYFYGNSVVEVNKKWG